MAWLWENSGFHRAWLCPPPPPHMPIRSYFPLKPFWILIAHLQQTMASQDLCFCHCRGCPGCGHENGWPEYQAGYPCWNQPAKGQKAKVANGWNPDLCRCVFCLPHMEPAAARAAAGAGAAAAGAAAAPAAAAEVADAANAAQAADAAAAKAEAAADAALQSASAAAAAAAASADAQQQVGFLYKKVVNLEEELRKLKLQRGYPAPAPTSTLLHLRGNGPFASSESKDQ